MRGLLLKDFYTLAKQMKFMLLVMVLFACIPGGSLSAFAVVYAAMLPFTALVYDERSKWDELAVMMPYSTWSIVGSKYILGMISVAIAVVISFVAQFVIGSVKGTGMGIVDIIEMFLLACIALILLCINLPLMFRLGVERGRIVFMVLICVGLIGGLSLLNQLPSTLENFGNEALLLLGALLLTVVLIVVSTGISVFVYRRKRG